MTQCSVKYRCSVCIKLLNVANLFDIPGNGDVQVEALKKKLSEVEAQKKTYQSQKESMEAELQALKEQVCYRLSWLPSWNYLPHNMRTQTVY